MLENFEYGKKYLVLKKWSRTDHGIANERTSVDPGELLRFVGPNWDGAWFRDAKGMKIVMPVKVAFRIMGPPNTACTRLGGTRRKNIVTSTDSDSAKSDGVKPAPSG